MNLDALTPRERQVCELMAIYCLTSKEIARRLGISYRTVEVVRAHVLIKLEVRNVQQLARNMALMEAAGDE